MARSGQGADARRGPSLWKAVPGRRRGRGPLALTLRQHGAWSGWDWWGSYAAQSPFLCAGGRGRDRASLAEAGRLAERAIMTARLAARNKPEMQRLERKAQRQARVVKGAAQMARSGHRGVWPDQVTRPDDQGPSGGQGPAGYSRLARSRPTGRLPGGGRRRCSNCCTRRWPSWPGSLAACSAG